MSRQGYERIGRLCLCRGFTGIKITNGKLICNTRLKRQLLKKASYVFYCHGGFIFPLKRWWYLTPPVHSQTHARTHTLFAPWTISCWFCVFSLLGRARGSLCHPRLPLQLHGDSRWASVLLQQRLRGRGRWQGVQRWASSVDSFKPNLTSFTRMAVRHVEKIINVIKPPPRLPVED